MRILVLNCGSSSVKYQLFDMAAETASVAGSIAKIGQPEPALTHRWGDRSLSEPVAAQGHNDALQHIRRLLLNPERGGVSDAADIAAVGHRVVHGGEKFVKSMHITPRIIDITQCTSSF